MTEHWFKPKTYGYGATPVHWKGWVATAIFCLISFAIAHVLIVMPAKAGTGPGPAQVAVFFALLGLTILAFIRLCRAKTDGEWRWRWGESDGGES